MFQNVLCIQMHCLRIIYHEFMNNLLSYYSFRMMHWLDAWKYQPEFLFQRLGCLKEYLVFFKWALFMLIRSLCYVANSKISLEKRSFEPRLKTCYVQMTQIKFLVCMRNDAQFRNKGLKVHGVFLFLLSLSSAKRRNTISRVIYTKLTQKELDWGALRWFCLVGVDNG